MNISELTAQSLSPRPCSMFTDGRVPQNSHTNRQIQSPQMLQILFLLKMGRVKCNESQVN